MTKKCPSCKIGTLEEMKKQKIVTHFSNPGDVIFEGMAEACDHCETKVINADDQETIAAFDKAYDEEYTKIH